jgi:tRNA threonylcarbamoyladenosine biosynthesis protein TsaB
MLVLALDTTTNGGSVALVDSDRVVVETAGDASMPHARRLPQCLLDVLACAGATLSSVDAFAVAVGPGSFTGIRIGIAAMQGLAMASGRPLAAVSVLEALGHAASVARRPGEYVGAWVDAYRGEVYAGLYRVCDTSEYGVGRLAVMAEPSVGRPEDIAADWIRRPERPAVIAGDGAMAYAGVLAGAVPILGVPVLAGAIGRMAAAREGEMLAPSAIRPLYIRRPDVEIARDRESDVRGNR